MNITYCDNYGSMSQLAGSKVIRELQHHEEPLLCAASGQSPTGLYQYLVKESKEGTHPLPALKVIKLDEWVGLPENHPATCEYYLRETLLKPLKIPDSRYISFDSNATDPMEECNRIQQELERSGPINVCIAGLGTNGHVGLIEPDQSLEPSCHIADLTPATLQDS